MKHIRINLHNKILKLRSIYSIILQNHIDQLWEEASEDLKKLLEEHVEHANQQGVLEWITGKCNYDEMSKSQLLEQAKKYHVKYYSRMTRGELLRSVKNEQAKYDKRNPSDESVDGDIAQPC